MMYHRLATHRRLPVSKIVLIAALMVCALALASGCGGDSNLTSSLGSDADQVDDDANNNSNNNGGGDAGFDVGTDTDPGGEDADTGTPDPCLQTTAQEAAAFADDYATGLCERLLTCGQNPKVAEFVSFGGWSTVAQCAQSVRAGTISGGQASQAASAGSLTLNSCKASECRQLLPNLDCLEIHRALTEARYTEIAACQDAWAGDLPDGASCTVDAQCEGAQVCARQDGSASCTGRCTDAGQTGSGQCGDITCAADQYCQTDNNICMTRQAPGAACQEDYECRLDAYCDGTTCVAVSTGRTDGQSCNGQDTVCGLDFACLNNQCTAFLGAGESCQFFGCEGDLFCNQDGQCEARRSGDASCDSDQQCESLRCAGGSCAALDGLCQ
jgi:hypothetical protein